MEDMITYERIKSDETIKHIFKLQMMLCRRAADKLGLQFKLMINEQQLI